MAAQRHQATLTVDEYLALDRAAEYKHEYVDGLAYAMAGGTANHGQLSVATSTILHQALRAGPCRVFSSDVRVEVAATRYFYPHVSVSCDDRDRGTSDILRHPRVVVEVLFAATERYDRVDKFAFYQGCASLEEYVLISQREALVDVYRRSPRGWGLHRFRAGDTVDLDSLDVRFSVDELYAGMELEGG